MPEVNMNVQGQCFTATGQRRPVGDARPNILLIISDEHNANVMGCAGDSIIQTPSMDRLAREGVMFQNCYTNCPICVPVRAAMTAGKYVSRIGSWNNFSMLPPATPSIARVLNAAGYDSYLVGKMHYDNSCRYGFKDLWWNMNSEHRTGLGPPRFAADDFSNEGGYPHFETEFGIAESSTIMRQAQRVTNGITDFLGSYDPADKPFFAIVGYEGPHLPMILPQAYYDLYKGRIPMPFVQDGDIEKLPRNYRQLRNIMRAHKLSDEKLRYFRELYYAQTQFIDEHIGHTLAALDKSLHANNTIIIYTTDHGEMLGEHGMLWKGAMYEESARVPLIVSYPKRWKGGQTRRGACSLLDVTRTVADVAGADVPLDWNGSSLVPWLDDPSVRWKDLAVSEYYAQQISSGFSMLRMGPWKYVYHTSADPKHGPERELFNLETDPHEFTNLANSPDHQSLIRDLHAALVREVGEDPESIELRARFDISIGYNRPPGDPPAMSLDNYPVPQTQGDADPKQLRRTL
ncbi:MAG: sulfatase-like hydrolase/transferase [Phycisphaerales bacterium]|nr:sulfatase-like hydrolase/transferase [Phycisphaerales bacterium]